METMEQFAMNKNQLKQSGRPIADHDIRIAALALQHQLSVLSRDEHFDHVPGLKRVSW